MPVEDIKWSVTDCSTLGKSWNRWKEYKRHKWSFEYNENSEAYALNRLFLVSKADVNLAIHIINNSINNGYMHLIPVDCGKEGKTACHK